MMNTNYMVSYEIVLERVENTLYSSPWKPWTHRIFLVGMIVLFVIKYRKAIKASKIKKHSTQLKLYSHEFEIKIKMNSEKELTSRMLVDKDDE